MTTTCCSSSRPRIAVVGAGVIGVTTATRISEQLKGLDITIISDQFSPNTTGDGAAGVWLPFLVGKDTEQALMERWCQNTFDFVEELSYTADSYHAGISLIAGCNISTEKAENEPFWKNIVHGYSVMTPSELRRYGPEYRSGYRVSSYTIECPRLLPYLMKRFVDNGGRIVKRKVQSLRELTSSYDVIINCTGVQAFHVTPDPAVHPVRGQVMNVKAPWIKHFVLDDSPDGHYVVPNTHSVVLGGTHQEDWNTQVDSKDSHKIWKGCCKLIPSVQHSTVVKQWVGLRPGRYAVRLERETINHNGKSTEVIHNYGHGGSGITLCWGCAGDAAKLLEEFLQSRPSLSSNSKL